MGVKYSFSRFVTATSVAAALLVVPSACKDDFDYRNNVGQQIAFKLSAPDAWHDGMSVNENAPTTRCLSVRPLSGGDTELYLHTVVADNPVSQTGVASRATPVNGCEEFKKTYPRFSLSGICYIGEYPTDESQNDWTTEYAYNLFYDSASGNPTADGRQLLWPANGSVRFFAFAPTVPDFEKLNNGGSLTLSDASQTGSPTLTYTVPKDVTKQIDLMTATETVTVATTPEKVNLEFGHALTAVRIKCGKGMLAGEITEVTIEGVNGTGTQVIGSDQWETSDPAKYTISQKIDLPADEKVDGSIVVPEGKPITGTATDNLTFMLLPQTLPEGAKMTIKFTDTATGTERTLSGSIAGDKWETGKIVTYSISPSSINIITTLDFNKKGAADDSQTGAVIPYSGVWYDVNYTATAQITQAGVETKIIEDDVIHDKVKFEYTFDTEGGESATWKACESDGHGLLKIGAQPAYDLLSSKSLGFKAGEKSSEESNPFSLSSEKGESANCYLVDQAGYYSLDLVYGNGKINGENTSGLKYYPGYNDVVHASGDISGVVDAVLMWQDAPDLIDPNSVGIKKIGDSDELVFRIREHTLTQGNAVLAVRGGSDPNKEILWSWHIWVTPYKDGFYSQFYHSETSCKPEGYDFAKYNLGWCDRHKDNNDSRKFRLRAVVDYGGGVKDYVEIGGTFTQMEFKGSAAGDNTYYQWGRKDPMLGGIYNSNTQIFKYNKKGSSSSSDEVEFTMENKQVFNEYNQDGYNYSFCKNPGDVITTSNPTLDPARDGVTIGYTIRHPYMFITNSRSTDVDNTLPFNYRNHWHCRYDASIPYLNTDKLMYNAWGASNYGYRYGEIYETVTNPDKTTEVVFHEDKLKQNASTVTKSVYDPCPPGFKMPPIDAFRGIAEEWSGVGPYKGLGTTEFKDNAWTMTYNEKSITFPATGVRNYALRSNEWKTIKPTTWKPAETYDYESLYKISMPAFRMLTFVSSATIAESQDGKKNTYQILIFAIDNRRQNGVSVDYTSATHDKPAMSCFTQSSNSYGMPVRAIKDN